MSKAADYVLARRPDARMDEDGHCSVCGCEVREYHGGSNPMESHECPEGFRVIKLGMSFRVGDVLVSRRADDFYACLVKNTKAWGRGTTPQEAIGDLYMAHADEFNTKGKI